MSINPAEILIHNLKTNQIKFVAVMATIDSLYQHTPTAFKNGAAYNEVDQNQGSAKIFIFAQQHKLPANDTLLLFAEHYQAVLDTPEGTDHQNIRQFMMHGWEGIEFKNVVFKPN